MSEMERNKGKLFPLHVDTEHFTDDDFELYMENGFAVIDGEIYQVEWEVRSEDCYEFADVVVSPDGVISFHTYHYNGGASWEEVVEDKLMKE